MKRKAGKSATARSRPSLVPTEADVRTIFRALVKRARAGDPHAAGVLLRFETWDVVNEYGEYLAARER